ncbi:uncharacterized protein with HEPN domain [Evansella vedderi]|uniref:Uncharacterized protein with HEPN domain n=1 Tax=Evansella vedderi TaxID=38282 RepID=A0ABT9ZZU8_9BACI|nr:uncharacterized protein with HEPN domain [Evansella vedderi]
MNKIENYTSDMTFDQFEQNKLIIDAVIRNLEVIGEAAKHISRKYKIKVHQFPLEKYCRT